MQTSLLRLILRVYEKNIRNKIKYVSRPVASFASPVYQKGIHQFLEASSVRLSRRVPKGSHAEIAGH